MQNAQLFFCRPAAVSRIFPPARTPEAAPLLLPQHLAAPHWFRGEGISAGDDRKVRQRKGAAARCYFTQ